MRKLQLVLIVLFQLSCLAQNKEVLYNFTAIPQSSLVNPGQMLPINIILEFLFCPEFRQIWVRAAFRLMICLPIME